MSFRDSMDHVALASEMGNGANDPYLKYLKEVDAAIAPYTPDGHAADLDGGEWVLVQQAFNNKQRAQLVALKIVHLRGWADDANDPLMVALRTSVALSDMKKDIRSIGERHHQLANFMQGLVQREEYDALVAENEHLRLRLAAVESLLKLKAVA